MSFVRILTVDDFEPWRRFVSSTLKGKPKFQIICEVADGFDSVRRAEELQPDSVVLDIGLPTLDGIEAADRSSKLPQTPK